MKHVIIHIGMTKTGTSSLQKALKSERALLSQHGIAYAVPPAVNHDLANAVVRDADLIPARWSAIEPVVEGASTILISCENFQLARPEGIVALKQFLDHRLGSPEFTIYIGIRRWADRLVSHWQQDVRFGETRSLSAGIAHSLAAPAAGHMLDVSIPISRWKAIFGPRAMLTYSLDHVLADGRDIVAHAFRELFAINAPTLVGRYAANVSIIEQTELVRAVNPRHANDKAADRRTIARSMLHFIMRRKPTALAACDWIASRLSTITIDDDHPLFRQLEDRSGYSFPSRPPQLWKHAADRTFDDPILSRLISALDRKALRRIEKQKLRKQASASK